MKLRRVYPLFLVSLALLMLLPSLTPLAHAGFKNSVKQDCTNVSGNCTTSSLPVSVGDLIMVHVSCYGGGAVGAITDTLGNTFKLVLTESIPAQDAIFNSFSIGNGNDAVSVNNGSCSSGTASILYSFSFDTFSGIIQIGQTTNHVTGTTTCTGTCTDSITLSASATSSIYETGMFTVGSNTNACPTSISSGSGASLLQTSCSQFTSFSTTFATFQKQLSIGGSASYIMSINNPAQFVNAWGHMIVELQTTTTTQTSITSCFGNCGLPAVTLVNTQSTDGINFNQSITIFYQFQTTLSGNLLNVTTNISKNYNNGQQASLGVYFATCNAGTNPFTVSCPGQLQASLTGNVNPVKGQLVLTPSSPLQVASGEWVAIAVTATFSGFDLNDTNTVVPLNQQSGRIPQILSGSTLNSCACKMGLWTWIRGNVVTGVPPPSVPISCGSDLVCFLIQSIVALTPSNPLLGAIFYGIAFSIATIGALAFFSLKTEVMLPTGLYILIFVAWMTFFASIIGAIWFVVLEILITILLFSGLFGQLVGGTFRGSGRQSA